MATHLTLPRREATLVVKFHLLVFTPLHFFQWTIFIAATWANFLGAAFLAAAFFAGAAAFLAATFFAGAAFLTATFFAGLLALVPGAELCLTPRLLLV